jgi:hypothetical protein
MTSFPLQISFFGLINFPLTAPAVFFEILILAYFPKKYLKRTLILIIKLLSMEEALLGIDIIVS